MQHTQVVEAEPVTAAGSRARASEERELPGGAAAAPADRAERDPHRRRHRQRRVHPVPVHRLAGRARVPVGRGRRRPRAVLHQHGDRALHARHRRDRDRRLHAAVEAVGRDPRRRRDPRHDVARLGDLGRDRRDVRVRRRRPERDRDRRPARDRRDADRLAGRLPDGREARSSSRSAPSCVFLVVALFAAIRPTALRGHDRRSSRASARSRARSRSRSSSARSRRPARAARTTSCRATGSATRASAWAGTCRASSPPSPARRRRRPTGERFSFPQDEREPGPLAGLVEAREPRAVRLVRVIGGDHDRRLLAGRLLDRLREPGPARLERLRLHRARGRRARRRGRPVVRHAVPGRRRGQPVRGRARASSTTSRAWSPTSSTSATRATARALDREPAVLHGRLDDGRRSASAILLLGFDQPLVLLTISTVLGGAIMFVYTCLLLVTNRRYLPDAIQLRGYRRVILVASVLLLGTCTAIVAVERGQEALLARRDDLTSLGGLHEDPALPGEGELDALARAHADQRLGLDVGLQVRSDAAGPGDRRLRVHERRRPRRRRASAARRPRRAPPTRCPGARR